MLPAALKRADVLDRVFTQFDGAIVGERHHAFLQPERDERDEEAGRENRCDGARESDAARFERGDLALAGKAPEREERAEQHGHRQHEHDNERQLPEKVQDCSTQRRVLFGNQAADREDVRRGEDQRERREPEEKRAAEFGDQIPVENSRPPKRRHR